MENSVRVALTKEEKVKVGKPKMPGYELDLVAYKGKQNEIMVVECKSYFDSPGVHAEGFEDPKSRKAERYKLFNDRVLWKMVRRALRRRLVEEGRCASRPKIRLCLAAGHVVNAEHRTRIKRIFDRHQSWKLMDDREIAREIKKLANKGYMNNEAVMVAKILERVAASDSSE